MASLGSVSSLVFMVPSVEVIVEEDNATRRHTADDASTQDKQRHNERYREKVFYQGYI